MVGLRELQLARRCERLQGRPDDNHGGQVQWGEGSRYHHSFWGRFTALEGKAGGAVVDRDQYHSRSSRFVFHFLGLCHRLNSVKIFGWAVMEHIEV